MRITNTGKRAFIVKASSVIDGGTRLRETGDVAIEPGDTVEVTDECGNALKTYSGIRIFDEQKKKGKK